MLVLKSLLLLINLVVHRLKIISWYLEVNIPSVRYINRDMKLNAKYFEDIFTHILVYFLSELFGSNFSVFHFGIKIKQNHCSLWKIFTRYWRSSYIRWFIEYESTHGSLAGKVVQVTNLWRCKNVRKPPTLPLSLRIVTERD